MTPKRIVYIAIALLAVLAIVVISQTCIGYNKDQNWQIVQSLGGIVTARDEAGFYWKGAATVWTYPRYVEATYNDDPEEGRKTIESIRATFNDAGTAQVSTFVRFMTPTTEKNRRDFHRQFSGNIENAINSVKSHMINCIKTGAPLMSASENQSSRKSEFNQIIENMLRNGLYEMMKVEKILKDRTDEHGQPMTIAVTEIITNENGMPKIAQRSPLEAYGIEITQFSITSTDYDPDTLKQFSAKKQAFLAAEQSKAEREQEVQQRLMVVEKGLREKAEVEAEANKVKAKLVIEAQQKVEVAEMAKLEAETIANKLLEVQKIAKEEAETKANMELEVAKINAVAAEEEKKAIISLAEGKEKAIELSGAITETIQVLAEIAAQRDVEIAKSLKDVKTPGIVLIGGGGNGTGTGGLSQKDTLMNLYLLKQMGIDIDKAINPAVANEN